MDTNIVGYILNGRSARAREMLKQTLADGRVTISAITEAEIRYGLELRPQAARLRASVEGLLQTVEVCPWDSDAARAYGRLRAWLKSAGKGLAGMDLLIAAHALVLGAVLVSHDAAFRELSSLLTVVDWSGDVYG